jgi:hypothetical protein
MRLTCGIPNWIHLENKVVHAYFDSVVIVGDDQVAHDQTATLGDFHIDHLDAGMA